MPQFCRHNRFAHLCPICSRESEAAAPPTPRRGASSARRAGGASGAPRRGGPRSGGAGSLRVRRLARAPEDGYSSSLLPGLRASGDAERLAGEIAFAAGRLRRLGEHPPGLWAEVASAPEVEEAIWLAFLIALLGPLEGEDPWAGIRAARTLWSAGTGLAEPAPATGPRGAFDPARRTPEAYRAWAARSGSQAAGLAGEPGWTPERRFARALERLALPGLHRGARFDLLATLGATARAALSPGALGLTGAGDEAAALGAKRVFGIGDPLLLERRAAALAEAGEVPLGALDLALASFEHGERIHGGVADDAADPATEVRLRDALGL